MARLGKDKAVLYCGTTERIAKLAPVAGINPAHDRVYLSDVYPGVLAFFASTSDSDRFGVIEVDTTKLEGANFFPAEWYLEQSSRQKAKNSREQNKRLDAYRKNLEKYKAKWRDSLQKLGVVVYEGFVSKKAIRKITIYDPASNPTVTHAIVNSRISLADHKRNYERNHVLTRWLTGESVSVEEWLGDRFTEVPKDEREKIAEELQNKSGLDVFFYEPPPKGS